MKFIYSCDLHGDENKYESLYKRAIETSINVIVLGGDLLPKNCNREVEQPNFIQHYLSVYFDRLQNAGIKCLCILGNDDIQTIDDIFNKVCMKYDNVINIDKQCYTIEDCNFIGLSNVLDHPFGCKDRVVIEENYEIQSQLSPLIFLSNKPSNIVIDNWYEYAKSNVELMETLLEKLPNCSKGKDICVFHMPPKNIGLDVTRMYLEVGSKAIYKYILAKQPYMTFHGHIHESPEVSGKWKEHIGKTLCVQPGQSGFNYMQFVYTIVDTDTGICERVVDYVI